MDILLMKAKIPARELVRNSFERVEGVILPRHTYTLGYLLLKNIEFDETYFS